MKTIRWPADGKLPRRLEGGREARPERPRRTWTDTASTPNGGNCYNCHQITKEEISFGTIGPSLYNYGKLRGVTDPNSPQAQRSSSTPGARSGTARPTTPAPTCRASVPRHPDRAQVRDIVALLLDPKSPVNQ
jgi:sulfur-oxidizing protein SoxX